MAPASTKYLRHRSSTPWVVRTTLAPEAKILVILSLVMSDSRARMAARLSWLETLTSTPSLILTLFRPKSIRAILALAIFLGIPSQATVQFRAYPLTSIDSLWDLPCDLSTLTDLMGTETVPLELDSFLTALAASTTMLANMSSSTAVSLPDMVVLATLIRLSRPSSSALNDKCSEMNLHACLHARVYPEMMEVGWIFCLTSSSAFLSSSAANMTTEVVPSPTSWSCTWANSTRTLEV